MAEEDETPEEWTSGDLADHCSWAVDKGYLNRSTGSAMATAVKKVFEYVHGEDEWAGQDIRDLDLDDTFQRFENLASRDLTGPSLQTYESRFRKALESYKLHKSDPKRWATEVQSSRRTRPTSSEASAPTTNGKWTAQAAPASAQRSASPAPDPAEGLVAYPFPVRPGVMAYLHLPADLKAHEVRRLSGFLESIAIVERHALPSGAQAEPAEG